MPVMPPVSEKELKRYPKMTRWFNPILLTRLIWSVVLSSWFGQFSDRRLLVAALDPAKEDEFVQRANLGLKPDADGALWVDFTPTWATDLNPPMRWPVY